MNDDDTFLQAMAGVKPLQHNQAAIEKSVSTEDFHVRRQAAEHHNLDSNPLTDHVIVDIGPHDIIEFRRDGVQHGVYKKLRLGKYSADARLDLHHHNVAQARSALYDFIQQCRRYDLRCLLILHGKGGRNGDNKKAVIKSHVAYWLKLMPEILAYHSSPTHLGGAGALFVLLAKTEKAKQENRERHGGK